MYLAQQYDWQAVLSFHGAVLLDIERGLSKWGDSFIHLESRILYGSARPAAVPTKSASPMPTMFCRDYQRNMCSHSRDHYGLVKGVKKWVKHICAACWVQQRKVEYHREGTSDCPLHTTTASFTTGTVESSKN